MANFREKRECHRPWLLRSSGVTLGKTKQEISSFLSQFHSISFVSDSSMTSRLAWEINPL